MLTFLHSLKSRLLFFIFIITLPGLIALFFQSIEERNKAIDVAHQRALAVVENITKDQVDVIEDTKNFLKRLAKIPLLLTPEDPECSEFLTTQRDLVNKYINLGAPSINGELLCNAYPLNKPVNVADRHYIQQAIINRDFSVGKFQLDRAAAVTSINFAYPIFNPNNNDITGLAVAVVSLDWWSKRLEDSHLPANSLAYITDRENTIIANYPLNKAQLGVPLADIQGVTVPAETIPDRHTQVNEDAMGHLRIFVNKELITSNGNGPVHIIVGIPFDEELAIINARFTKILIFVSIFFVLIILLAIWTMYTSVITPLKALKASTKQLELGNKVNNQFRGGAKELIDLQKHFISMAKTRLNAEQQLKDSQTALQESKSKLSLHLQNTPLGSFSWDKNCICSEWNEAAEAIFGYSAEEAVGQHIAELLVPLEKQDDFYAIYNQLFTNNGGTLFANRDKTKDGRSIICNWYNTPIMDINGVVTGIGTLVQDVTDSKHNQDTLNKFFDLPMHLHMMAGFDCSILKMNKGWETTLGYVADELLGRNFLDFVHPDDIEISLAEMASLGEGKTTFNFENRFRNTQGEYRLLVWSAIASVEEQTIYAVGVDITERRFVEEKQKLAASVFTHAKEGIMITDVEQKILDVNDTFSQFTGYTREEALGKKPNILRSGRQSREFYVEMWRLIEKEGHWTGEIWNKRKNGEIYPQILTISTVYDSAGKVQNYVALFTDITAIKEQQRQLEHVAHYDLLTNLPNRTLLSDRLIQAMAQCQRHNQSLAVVFLDLDGFKAINDTNGHDAGDKLLVELALRMEKTLRNGDTLSRFGGDEFVAILTDLDTIQDCEPILDRLLASASKPAAIDGVVVKVSASVGVTIYPHDSADADQLIRHADQAMYTAKQEGKNRYHLFDMEQDIALKCQHEGLLEVRTALKQEEFVLYYQPKVNMKTGELIGVEALIRWQHPTRGLLPPIEFLPLIENNDLSIDLGEWVIVTALSQISAWQALGLNIPVSVNIDAMQLQQESFVNRLQELLAQYPEVRPYSLQLEVLETSALSDIEGVSKIMHGCIKHGVGFALDDFGTGYCSLTYLKQLPVNLIKIDQSFIRGMLDDSDDLSIVNGVVGLAKAFQREVIAEGVETIEHGVALLRLNCYLAQGYGIARPMPAEELPVWASAWQPDDAWLSTDQTR